MDYFISRDGQQYGPYTLADLQRYVSTGEVSLADLVTSDALTQPVSVSQIIGNIAATPPPTAISPFSMAPEYPDPPNLHWGLVLLFGILTCGIFLLAWQIVQAAWLKRIEPASRALYYYGAGLGLLVFVFAAAFLHASDGSFPAVTIPLFRIAYYVIDLCGRFSFKNSMEEHYNVAEPMGLGLSGVMTFFFGSIYFQYHINDIVRRKTADRLFAATR